ncbi:MAG: hypothetical protein ACE5O2_13365 [Armatimonadota bacterium]
MNDLLAILLPAVAMGLGWGIRGQFGHETGAMVPGALVGLALGVVSVRNPTTAQALRLAAVAALACSLGGVMTYGQTLGLVHDQPRSPTFAWGLLGVAIKGGAWIGLTAVFIGVAGSGVRCRPLEVALLLLGLAVVAAVGVRLLNRPHNPPDALPLIYFSKRFDARPRPEFWGGLWLALLVLLAYLWFMRANRFAVVLGCWGILGGAAGFVLGECLQAWGVHSRPFGDACQRWLDWWKVMEVTFGAVAGAALGLGWRRLEPGAAPIATPAPGLPLALELVLLILWMGWLIAAEVDYAPAASIWELSFVAVALPIVACLSGRLSPAFVVLPLLVWVSGDNVVQHWVGRHRLVSSPVAWTGLSLAFLAACAAAYCGVRGEAPARTWLVLTAWIQTALTLLWAFGTRAMLEPIGALSRLLAAGSALAVESAFVLIAILLTILAHLPK